MHTHRKKRLESQLGGEDFSFDKRALKSFFTFSSVGSSYSALSCVLLLPHLVVWMLGMTYYSLSSAASRLHMQ